MSFTMKAIAAMAVTMSSSLLFDTVGAQECPLIGPTDWNDVGVKVLYDNRVPVTSTDAESYNMMVAENFDTLIFIDQLSGKIYEYDEPNNAFNVIFDIETFGAISGIAYSEAVFNGNAKKVHQIVPGINDDEVYVVFTSDTFPNTLVPFYNLPEDELYREGLGIPGVNPVVFKVFVKFDYVNSALTNPEPFFAIEMHNTAGHDGGAMLTLTDESKILYGVGDCLPFGLNGREASQDLNEHCGKILLIDPETGSAEIAAAGVRNSQQMNLYDDLVVFMDIGGVTAEEVNAIPLADLLDTSVVENFGWGIRAGEDFGREGIFKVEPGIKLTFGEPKCISVQDKDDLKAGNDGNFVTPWMQFGRAEGIPLFGVSGAIVSESSFDKIKLAATEFNTGLLICTNKQFKTNGSAKNAETGQFVRVYDENGQELIGGVNALVAEDLGLENPERGDARLFNYPNGDAGLFIERIGTFYKLEEFKL